MILFKTVGSTYVVDDETRVWSRVPGTHGPSGDIQAETGHYSKRTQVALGQPVVIYDEDAVGVFTTSVVTEIVSVD